MDLTKVQFLANPRSAVLRAICLEYVNISFWVMRRMVLGSAVPWAMTRWDTLVTQLRDLGITPEMHAGLSEDAYDDPVVFAEYIAGQCLAVAMETNNRALLIEANGITDQFANVEPAYTLWRKTLEWFAVEQGEQPQ